NHDTCYGLEGVIIWRYLNSNFFLYDLYLKYILRFRRRLCLSFSILCLYLTWNIRLPFMAKLVLPPFHNIRTFFTLQKCSYIIGQRE
uniref:Uncharacterized protein n=1 Tax=Aegilops tauschii subsp. strangulata TaxID=200361 RepID=A0A453I9E6_AEGTS